MKPDTGAAPTESLPGVTKGNHREERREIPPHGHSEAGLQCSQILPLTLVSNKKNS